MSIIIQNITHEVNLGPDKYVVRVNETIICEFEHDRKLNGLAQCLRDAANAVDVVRNKEHLEAMVKIARACT